MIDALPRSRVLTWLGWILFAIGATIPVRFALQLAGLSTFFFVLTGIPRYRASMLVGLGIKGALALLSTWSGWGLARRRTWAPSAAFVAGGATLVDSLYLIFTLGPASAKLLAETIHTKYAVVGYQLALPILLEVGVALCWLITLGVLLRNASREEFDITGHPVSSLWASFALSALICAGLKALEAAFFWAA